MFLGMLFYARMNGWSYTASYYYSVQAGMSVGFGALAEEVPLCCAQKALE